MAKKRTTPTAQTTETKRTTKDKKTLGSIRDLADGVVQSAERGRAPYVDIPSRSLSNVRFNQIEAHHRDGQRDATGGNCSIWLKPAATCKRCWSVPDASN